MTRPRDRATTRTDADGVRVSRSPGPRRDVWLAVAAGTVVIAVTVGLRGPGTGETEMPRDVTRPPTTVSPTDRTGRAERHPRDPTAESSAIPTSPRRRRIFLRRIARKLPHTVGPEGKRELDARVVIPALQAAGRRDGIAAFPPPGSDPPRSGIIVPDDFALPEGYLRHHQSTDDGKPLPPILLVHPDYELIDDQGNAVPTPEGRVVPPELAPPGLPIRLLEVPSTDAGRRR